MARLATALALALAAGCAVRGTRIVTDDREALIWLDGRYVGRGEGRVRQVGPPHTGRILVTAPDGRRARALLQRSITPITLEAGFRTLGVCLVFCWEYPRLVEVPLPAPKPKSGWAVEPATDPWLLPPGAAPSPWDEPPRWNGPARSAARAGPALPATPRGAP